MNRFAITLIEVMVAVSLASFVAAIGFTGISAFGKSITRAKQFTSETELITTAMRMAVANADIGATGFTALPTPRSWVQASFSGNTMTMTLASHLNAGKFGGRMDRGLQMTTSASQINPGVSSNQLVIAALSIYRP